MSKKIYTLFWIILLCYNNIVISQTTCSGSLGDPIVNVTFGQGANPGAPFSISVPGASTSYAYSAPTGNPASNTVFDGQYALVNSVPSNPAWLTAGDHTNPGSGYMAFFNAAPTPGEFYSQTVTGLCAGTSYEFAAWILNAINSNILPNAVEPNVTFKIYNPANLITPIVSFSTGNIPAQNTILWRRFSTLFTTPMGINSVILVLSNNNVGGTNLVGNDMAIDDITFRACGPLTVASFSPSSVLSNLTLCKNVPYTLYGTSGAGLSTPSYQWQVSSDNGATWLNIATANSLIYTSPGNNSGLYKFRLQSQEAGNTGSSFCKFYSAPIDLTVTNCIGTKIINDYTPIQSLDICKNIIVVEDGSKYNVGDTVLLIQMKGAVIDSSNTASFGNITDYKSAGNYEFNYVKSRNGNGIELKNKIIRTYEIPVGKVQLIRVPYFTNYIVTDTLTCLPWDGSKGGVLVLNVQNTLTLNNPIDVSGKGFKGGIGFNTNASVLSCNLNEYSYPISNQLSGLKGESITTISDNKIRGKGKLAGGGGGGLGHNSGGGGGGNGGNGGLGGYQLNNCGNAPFDNRGIGGSTILTNTSNNKIFLGSGGGAGQADNPGNIPPGGGNGGGMIIISCNNLQANTRKIISNGFGGVTCFEAPGSDCHDGMGGGGAGGTVLLTVNTFLDNLIVSKNGGNGANVSSTVASAGKIGPGGGGAGGFMFLSKPILPPQLTSLNLGGQNGVLVLDNNSNWGATPGTNGLNIFNLNVPISTIAFKPNIDSVRINTSQSSCTAFNFNGLGFTNTNPIASWQWSFGDGATATGQNTTHSYATANAYLIKLIVTDINGCKDSISTNIISNSISIDAGADKTFCGSQSSVQLNSNTPATGTVSWSSNPSTIISNNSSQNPTAAVSVNTTFYVTITNPQGCSGKDSVKVFINTVPIVKTLEDISICRGTTLQLSTTIGLNSYQWTNGLFVSDSTISNPFFIDSLPRILIVTGSNGFCIAKDTISINIKPSPFVKSIPDTLICSNQNIMLTTIGANNYSWSPNFFLNNYNASNPTFLGDSSIVYFVTGTASNGCTAKDTVVVSVTKPKTIIAPPNKSFCTNSSVVLNGNNGNAYTYNWSPYTYLSNSTIINPVANPPGNFTYNVNIKSRVCEYDSNFSVMVIANPLPILNATKSNDITCLIPTAKLNVTGAIQYTWDPSSTLNNLFISNPVANPVINTEYIVTGVDINGCKGKDKITVLANMGNNTSNLPNAFTPNGDGKNDCFGLKGFGSSQKIYFIIYNRWGEKVFETKDINTCWNGLYKGHLVEGGNYVYYITAKTSCGDIVRKGNVILIR